MSELDRRQFVAFLLATMAAASAPALLPARKRAYVVKRWAPQIGGIAYALAQDGERTTFVEALVVGVRKVGDGLWLWAVDCEPTRRILIVCDDVSEPSVAVAEAAFPDRLVRDVVKSIAAGNRRAWEHSVVEVDSDQYGYVVDFVRPERVAKAIRKVKLAT